MSSFYNITELKEKGLKAFGSNVFISKKCSIYSPEKITIGNNVRIDDFCLLSGKIDIGNFVHISAYSAIYGKNGVKIEDYSGLSPRCTIFSATDDFSGEFMISPMVPEHLTNIIGGEVIIKRFSQIGAGTILLPNINIEEGTAVGAMSLVNKSTEPWGVYAGIPSKRLKDRKKNILNLYDQIK